MMRGMPLTIAKVSHAASLLLSKPSSRTQTSDSPRLPLQPLTRFLLSLPHTPWDDIIGCVDTHYVCETSGPSWNLDPGIQGRSSISASVCLPGGHKEGVECHFDTSWLCDLR